MTNFDKAGDDTNSASTAERPVSDRACTSFLTEIYHDRDRTPQRSQAVPSSETHEDRSLTNRERPSGRTRDGGNRPERPSDNASELPTSRNSDASPARNRHQDPATQSHETDNGSRAPSLPSDALPPLQIDDRASSSSRPNEISKKNDSTDEDSDAAKIKEGREAAKEKLEEGLKLLATGDFAGLQKLAQELQARHAFGALGLQMELSRATGMGISFKGDGRGGMTITMPDSKFDPHTCDAIRSGTTLEISRDGKVTGAYKYQYGGFAGLHEEAPIDTAIAQKQLAIRMRSRY